jgi:hypothetical protein
MEQPWTRTRDEVLQYFKVEEDKGLSEEAVKKSFDKYGPNGKHLNRVYFTNSPIA